MKALNQPQYIITVLKDRGTGEITLEICSAHDRENSFDPQISMGDDRWELLLATDVHRIGFV